MSVPVSLDRLGEELARFGNWAYVLTVSDGARPHAVSVELAWDGAVFRASGGRRTVANAGARPSVSLLWPPYEPGGYSLIVDADAAVDGESGLVLTPTTGVLHRTGPSPDPTSGCASDCVPLTARS
jgi:hypothetical protein